MAEKNFTDGQVFNGGEWLAEVATVTVNDENKSGTFILSSGDITVALAVLDEMESDAELPPEVRLIATDRTDGRRVELTGLMIWNVPVGFQPADIMGKPIIFSYQEMTDAEDEPEVPQ